MSITSPFSKGYQIKDEIPAQRDMVMVMSSVIVLDLELAFTGEAKLFERVLKTRTPISIVGPIAHVSNAHDRPTMNTPYIPQTPRHMALTL